jgi:hypothetical protein
VSEQKLKWRNVMFLGSELTPEEVRGIRELVAREVVKNMSAVHVGVLEGPGVVELPQPLTDNIMVAVNAIGGYHGVVRVNYITKHGVTGLTLSYWLMEGARTAEGLRVRVAVGRGGRIDFVVEGVVPSAKGEP